MMYKNLRLYIFLIYIFLAQHAPCKQALIEPWRVVSYGQNEGIPQGKLSGVYMQKNGTIWVGNQNGIANFDGYRWHNISYINNHRLHSEYLSINELNNGSFITLHHDTLYEIKNRKYRKILYTINNKIQTVLAYVGTSKGTEFLLTKEKNIQTIKLIIKRGKYYKIIKTINDVATLKNIQLFVNRNGSVIFNNGFQLFLLSENGHFKNITPIYNGGINVTKTQNDDLGNIYFYLTENLTSKGFYIYTTGGKLTKENPFKSNVCISFDVSKEGNVIALSDAGKMYKRSNSAWQEWGLFDNELNKSFVQISDKGNVWVGATNKLLNYNTNQTKCKTINVGNTYETNSINDIFIDKDGNTWLAKNLGITVIDKHNNKKEIINVLGTQLKNVTTINQDTYGNIWIGSGVNNNSTYKYDGNKFTRIGLKDGFTNNSLHKIWKDTEGKLWFSVFDNSNKKKNLTDGIYILQDGKFSMPVSINNLITEKRVYAILFDTNGYLWIGTNNRLIKYKNGVEKTWYTLDNERIGKVSDIAKDKKGKIWFAASNIGISNIDANNIVSISKQQKTILPLAYSDIEFDSSNTLWYSGKEVLSAYQNDMLYHIGLGEGIIGQTSWPIKSVNNTLLVGTYGGGLNVLNLQEINTAKPIIEVVHKHFSDNSIFIKWIALSSNNIFKNSKIKSAWRIDSSNWQVNSDGSIAMHNMAYGKHIFEIKTYSELPNTNDGIIQSIALELPYPFYRTWYFILPIVTLIILLIISILFFIQKRTALEKQIKQKEEHLQNIGSSLPIIPFLIDEHGMVLESFEHRESNIYFTLTPNEKLVKQVPEKYKNNIKNALSNCIKQNISETVEVSFIKYGENITYEFRFSPYTSNYTRKTKIAACVAINVSQNKKNEEALIKARLTAESADKAKMLFLTNMSHEIRTPMNAIVGITDILLEEDIDKKHKDNLHIIKHSADNLLVIINDILDFSKIEAGKIELEQIEFNIREMLDNVLKTFLLKTTQKDISFEILIDEEIPQQLIGDPFRLNQVLINIINNAIKFTHEGKVTCSIKTVSSTNDIITIKFCISDTGIGISKSKIDTIFESFTQESNVITRKYGGTGLGLTISKKLVEMQSGKIWVESKIGVGSTFTIEMPFEISNNTSTFTKNITTLKDLSDLKVLVVEDNSMNQIVANQLLKKWKANVDTVSNGIEAIEILCTNTYDVILMDLQMPHMDGYEATKIIRDKNSKVLNHNVPIIALTADAFPEIKRKTLDCGMNDFISKPFKQDELFVKLAQYGYQLK